MAFGPPNNPWDVGLIRARGTLPSRPSSGIDVSQGSPYDAETQAALSVPLDPHINQQGWINPYSLTFYGNTLSTTIATRVAPQNQRRCYLIIQNQGPGNVWINFGIDATAATTVAPSNGLQLISTQIYEQIGGGGIDPQGFSRAVCFVTPDFVSAITDNAATTILVGEGVWRFVQPVGANAGKGF